MSVSFAPIVLWILRHSPEIPAVVPLLKDLANYGGVEECVDDAIALLQWFKPLAHDFPGPTDASTLSAYDDAAALALFGGDGTKLARLVDLLQKLRLLWQGFKPAGA